MSQIAPTKLLINGVTMPFVPGAPFELAFTRGPDWHVAELVVGEGSDADKKLQKMSGAVTITIECSDRSVVGKDSKKFKEWYILSRKGKEQGFAVYQLADVRWRQNHEKLTAQYNVVSYGGKYRKDSLRNGAVWKAYDAVQDALEKLGFTVANNPKLDAAVKTIQLPDNLGNSEGGGWVGATLAEALPPMLEAIHCDIVPDADGKIMIVDRSTDALPALKDFLKASGRVSDLENHWQKPREIDALFERRIERRAEYTEDSHNTSSGRYDPGLENVIPEYNDTSGRPVEKHTELTAYVAQRFMGLQYILQRWTRVRMFDVNGGFNAAALLKMQTIETLVRQCFRRRFRFVTRDSLFDDVRARYAMIELGRLKADGTNAPDAAYLDYTEDLRFFDLANPATDNPLTAVTTRSVPISDTVPAPFTARWVDRENLIFHLESNTPDRAHIKDYFPGLLSRPRGFGGTLKEALRGGKLELDTTVSLTPRFRLKVFWHGLFVGNPVQGKSRAHNVRVPAFSDGEIDRLTLRLDTSLTANFGYDGSWPGTLLNKAALEARAKDLAKDAMASMEAGESGVSVHAGIDVLTRGKAWVNGTAHSLSIVVNARKPGSVETRITVLPGRRAKAQPVFTGVRAEGSKSRRIL